MKNLIVISIILAASVSAFSVLSGEKTSSEEAVPAEKRKVTALHKEHLNIVIVPDMSNRVDINLHQRPIQDETIINTILDQIHPKLLTSGNRRTHQKDRYCISFTNQRLITQHGIQTANLEIDFSRFDRQIDRIEYINGRNKESNFGDDLRKMKEEITSCYEAASRSYAGADVWSFFNNLSENLIRIDSNVRTAANGVQITNKMRNIIVLLTDGYIEAAVYPKDRVCNSLSQARIADFRKNFLRSGQGRTVKQFFSDEHYGITPIDNEMLENTEVLVMEIDDRSLDNSGNALLQPSDAEIIDIFWMDWFEKSNVKRFSIEPVVSSQSEAQTCINRFLGV